MTYDKTVFKPDEISTLGRYKFSVAGGSGETDDALPTQGSASPSANDEAVAPSQFDLGDFSKMEPATTATAADGAEDELPLLGAPEVNQ